LGAVAHDRPPTLGKRTARHGRRQPGHKRQKLRRKLAKTLNEKSCSQMPQKCYNSRTLPLPGFHGLKNSGFMRADEPIDWAVAKS